MLIFRTPDNLQIPTNIDAAFKSMLSSNQVCYAQGCQVTCKSPFLRANDRQTQFNLSSYGLPCNIDAAFSDDNSVFIFKGKCFGLGKP